jgi:hypothetical protein
VLLARLLGVPIFLEELLYKAKHSLIDQSPCRTLPLSGTR